MRKSAKTKPTSAAVLKGWKQVAAFLGHPSAVVQRWASEGMPVRREGRFVITTPDELNAWLGKQSGRPVHVATEDIDLAAELKRGLAFIRNEKQLPPKKETSLKEPTTRVYKMAPRDPRRSDLLCLHWCLVQTADQTGRNTRTVSWNSLMLTARRNTIITAEGV